ncbi:MAG: nucleotidyltransferase family protein [Acidobacteriia bacterium]|nr:nucleotidyltransferase family protein [Terriglobia bacterium]
MNLKIAQEILGTLQISGKPCNCRKGLAGIRPGQWEGALSWLRRSGLALYWWSRIRSGQAEGSVPETIRGRFDDDRRENGARLSAMTEEFQTLLNLFKDAGVPYAVLKGFALTPEYCPDPALRNQYDFDFLVDAGSVPRIDNALRQAAFIQKPPRSNSDPIEYFHSQRRPVVPKKLDGLFLAGLHRTVEIHTRLWELNAEKIRFALPDDSLSRAVLKTWNGMAFFSLAPEEALVLQVLHIFRHILNNQCRLSHLFELAIFLNQHAGENPIWPAFQAVVQKNNRLMGASGIVFSLAAGLFKAPVPGLVRAFTVDRLTRASAFWVHRYGIHSALTNFAASKSSLYLHSLFVDSKKDWQEIRQRRLFPIQRPATVARASSRSIASRLTAQSTQFAHVVRRSWFHGVAALKYVWGLPEWQRGSKSRVRVMNSNGAAGVAPALEVASGD